jgi:hypothetical protein
MAIHDFSQAPRQNVGGDPQREQVPTLPVHLPGAPNLARITNKPFDDAQTKTNDVTAFVQPGWATMDRGVKEYFSDIKVQVKDVVKSLTVRVAGGDKSILYWKQDLKSGRIQLPVMSINRGGVRQNPQRQGHPVNAAYRRFTDREGTRMLLTPREWPCLIDYTLSIWTERKEDMELITYQIVTRFNPLAEWRVQDEHMHGPIIAKLNNVSDVSDKEAAPDTLAKVKYDISITIEGWLWLPGRIVPTVLGQVQVLQDYSGEVYGGIDPPTL